MDLSIALADLAYRYQVPPHDRARLRELAGLDAEPANVKPIGIVAIAILGGAFIGLGVIFWIAANWDEIGRIGKFTLLQFLVVAMCAGAIWRPRARQPLSVIAILGIGGVFAYFGQTYQTGADPWQLFAFWAALALPICLSVRHDVTWLPWILVFGAALSLWVDVHVSRMAAAAVDLPIHLAGWFAALMLCAAMSPLLQRWSGAGPWSMRLAALLAIYQLAPISISAVFVGEIAPQYWFGLAVLAGGAAIFASARIFDLMTLSAIALTLDALLIVGIGRVVLDGKPFDQGLSFLMIGIAAAIILSFTVKVVMACSNKYARRGIT